MQRQLKKSMYKAIAILLIILLTVPTVAVALPPGGGGVVVPPPPPQLESVVVPVAASGGITPAQLDAMALDPQSWRLTFDTRKNPVPELGVYSVSPDWDGYQTIIRHPVVNWERVRNNEPGYPRPVFPAGVTPRQMRGAIIMVEFPDRSMISSRAKGSEIMGNPKVDTGVYGLQGEERATALQNFWRGFLNEPIPELNRNHNITGGWLEYSSGLWTLEMEVFGPFMVPHFQFMYPSVGTFWTTGALAIQNFGNFDFRGQFPKATALAGHASRLAVEANVPFIDDVTGERRHDFIFFTIAGYCQSPTWQEFGMMMFESPYVDANGNGINRNENFGWGEHQTVRSVRRSIADVQVVRDPISHEILEGVTGMDFTGYAHIQRIIDTITAPGFDMAEQWPNFFMLNVEELWRTFVQTIPAPNGQTFAQYRTAWQNAINPETGLSNVETIRNQFNAEFPNSNFTNTQFLNAIVNPLFLAQYAEQRKFEQITEGDAQTAMAAFAAANAEVADPTEEEEENYFAIPEMMDFAHSLFTPAFIPFGSEPPEYSQLYLEWFAANDPATAFDRLYVLLREAQAEARNSEINPYFQAAPSRYVPWTSWYGGCNVWSHASSLSLIHPMWAGQINFSAQGEGAGMAVYSHELGHIVGLPDTYNLKYNAITTRPFGGVWDLMDAGDKPGYYGCHARWDVPGLRGGNVGTSIMLRQMIASGFTDLTTQVHIPEIPRPDRHRLRPDPENSVDVLHVDYNDFRVGAPIVTEVFGRNVPVNRGFLDAHGNPIEGFMGIIIQGVEFRDQTPGVLTPPIFGTTNVLRAGNNILGVDLNKTAAEQPLSSLPRNPHGHLIIDPDRWNWYIGGNATNISYAETGIQGLTGRQHGFALEVVDRTGYDSMCPDHGVIISRIAHTNALRAGGIDHAAHLIIDAHPGSMNFVQYWEPDGSPYMMADCHRVGISAAAFHAGLHNNPYYYRLIECLITGVMREDPFRRFLPDDPRPGHAGHTVNEWVDEFNNFHFYILARNDHDGRYGTFISYDVAVRSMAPGAYRVGGGLELETVGNPTSAAPGNFSRQTFRITHTGDPTATDIIRIVLEGDLAQPVMRTTPGGYEYIAHTKEQNVVILNNLYAIAPGEVIYFDVFIRVPADHQGDGFDTIGDLGVWVVSETTTSKFGSFAGVVVLEPVLPTAVTITGATTVNRGSSIALSATVTPAEAAQAVEWAVTGHADATISATGVLNVPATVPGNTVLTVRATAAGTDVFGTHTVTVAVQEQWPGPGNGVVTPPPTQQQPTDPDDNGYDEDDPQVPLAPPGFVDVPGHWAREAIEFVHERGIMLGVSDTMFAPDAVLTRAMMATILWRLEGEPSVTFAPVFSDVPAGQWYSEAIVWASEQDIVRGIGGGLFDPHSNITREQFAAMMHRYAVFIGVDTEVPATHSLAQFTDQAQIGEWALGYVMWANYNELLTGVTVTTLQPQGNVTRAQCATVLHRFIVRFVEE